MSIKFGNLSLVKMALGDKVASKVYFGDDLVLGGSQTMVMWNQAFDPTGTNMLKLRVSVKKDGEICIVRKTSTSASTTATGFDCVASHRLYVHADVKNETSMTSSMYTIVSAKSYDGTRGSTLSFSTKNDGLWYNLETLWGVTSAYPAFSLRMATSTAIDSLMKLKNTMVVDLTEMFGEGNEPASLTDPKITWIKSYFSTHQEYNAGELIPYTGE